MTGITRDASPDFDAAARSVKIANVRAVGGRLAVKRWQGAASGVPTLYTVPLVLEKPLPTVAAAV
ncbi:MAG TPA: hypothetical protein VER55_02785 [Ardenticatenaceae bacterium]|nr:hypothetical protein [Ardenticatenaceae bacterium]